MKKTKWQKWSNIGSHSAKEYVCGYCGMHVGTNHAYYNDENIEGHHFFIYICTNCGLPTLFYDVEQYPGPLEGRTVNNLPENIDSIYKEIKNSLKNNCYTGAILLGRKLLMHLAVDISEAPEGKSFVEYIDHLKKSGFIPPNGDKILKFIKDLGNEKNHEIKIGTKEEAYKMLKFIEGLLIFIYEFPAEMTNEEN